MVPGLASTVSSASGPRSDPANSWMSAQEALFGQHGGSAAPYVDGLERAPTRIARAGRGTCGPARCRYMRSQAHSQFGPQGLEVWVHPPRPGVGAYGFGGKIAVGATGPAEGYVDVEVSHVSVEAFPIRTAVPPALDLRPPATVPSAAHDPQDNEDEAQHDADPAQHSGPRLPHPTTPHAASGRLLPGTLPGRRSPRPVRFLEGFGAGPMSQPGLQPRP